MSRSRKKNPITKDHWGGKFGKRMASKAVRRSKDFSLSGGEYKKIYESWNINDYISYYSKEDAIKDWYDEEAEHCKYQHLHKKYGTLERWLKAWEKMSLRK